MLLRSRKQCLLLCLVLLAAAASGRGCSASRTVARATTQSVTPAAAPDIDELWDVVAQRLDPLKAAAAAKNPDDIIITTSKLAAGAAAQDASGSEDDSGEDADSAGQQQAASAATAQHSSSTSWLQPLLQQLAGAVGRGDAPPAGDGSSSAKDPPAGPIAGTELPGFAMPGVPGSLREPPPPITTLNGAAVVVGGSMAGGATSNSTTSDNNTVSSSAAGDADADASASMLQPEPGSESWPAAIRQLGNPSCVWMPAEQNCMPTQDNWLIPQGVPSSPWRRANLLAIARQRHCEQHSKEALCWADQRYRCYWHNKAGQGADCRSADLLEVAFYSGTGFAGTPYDIPAAMACPGSRAELFQRCFGHPAAADHCDKLEGCFSVQQTAAEPPQQGGLLQPNSQALSSICLPRFFAGLDSKQIDEFLALLWSLDSRVYGACQANCWMKQARSCQRLRVTSRKECEAVPFCSYDRSKSRCQKKALEFETDFDHQVKRLYGMCVEIDNAEDCRVAEKTKPKPRVDWKSYQEPHEPVAKCEAP